MENMRADITKAEERYHTLFDNIPGATAIYKGLDMEIVMANTTMINFWGKDKSVIGQHLLDAVPELRGQPFFGYLQDVYRTGVTYALNEAQAELFVDGRLQTFYYDFTYKALVDANGVIDGVIHSATDVTNQVMSKRHILENDKRLNFSLRSANIGTWSLDLKTNMMLLDDTAKQLFGLENEDVLGFDQTLKHVHSDDLRNVYHSLVSSMMEENSPQCDVRFRIIDSANHVSWLECTGKAVFADKTVERFAGIVRDITKEIAGIESERKLQHQKDNFLSIASHELKTPVTSIKAYAQLLERMLSKDGDTQKADMMSRLTGQVNRLTSLLDDLLDVSKISNDRLNFKRDYYDFNEIVTDNIRDYDFQEKTHKIDVQLDFSGNIFCDRMRVSQVINNLISNAIKYSPDGDRILITTRQRGTDLVCSVQDFGIGISKENVSKVFDQFYRVSNTEVYSYQGMGLGLFISAEIIKQEGGRIWVESEEAMGSTFCFALPLGNNIR